MLLATSNDKTASVWNVPYGTMWSFTPRVALKGHKSAVNGGAFLGDESQVVTGSVDNSLRTWSTVNGAQTGNYDCGYVRHALFYFYIADCA